jgi:hypothetical protein
MPRPNRSWERKYGIQSKQPARQPRLSMTDDILSAARKLAGQTEGFAIILQALRQAHLSEGEQVIRLLDMDGMQMYGNRIVKAYHDWAKNDYGKLLQGVKDRDESLIVFINSVQE